MGLTHILYLINVWVHEKFTEKESLSQQYYWLLLLPASNKVSGSSVIFPYQFLDTNLDPQTQDVAPLPWLTCWFCDNRLR